MQRSILALVLVGLLPLVGCATRSLAEYQASAKPAIERFRAGQFDEASRAAADVVQREKANPYARLIRAITRYKQTMHQLFTDVQTVVLGGLQARGFNHRYMRSTLEQTEKELAQVDEDLAGAYEQEGVSLELCLACWKIDWNHNGRVDSSDERLFEIEQDADGKEIPEQDPRRRPVFRFDRGDVAWARAFVSFQRAALDLLLAYQWTELDKMMQRRGLEQAEIRIRLERPELVVRARELILCGLDQADRARRDYLAESDDDREWLPNPRQKSHPLPLPVDESLYRTWEEIVGDLRRMVQGEEGVNVAEAIQLGDHRMDQPPGGFVNIGRMLSHPKDLVLNLGDLGQAERDPQRVLKLILGEYYVDQMKSSPITGRLGRMKKEIDRGGESLERKLRYLFWLN